MSYYFNKVLQGMSFEETIDRVTAELQKEGFGVLTKIDIRDTFKKKLDIDFKKYMILGACHPKYAYQALQNVDKIGVFLPCNIVIEEHENGTIEVAVGDPITMMGSVNNDALFKLSDQIRSKLLKVIEGL